MDKQIFNFSFDEIINEHDNEIDVREERLIEIKRYEKMYLLKPQSNYDVDMADITDEERLTLFDNVVFCGSRRNYVEDLSVRDYSLEGCTPYQFAINNLIIEENSWGDMLCKIVTCLFDMFPDKIEGATEFRCFWTKSAMFTTVPKTNCKAISEKLYLNCNHTALHSCWLLQELLDYFNVDKTTVRFLIHRPCCAERKELRLYLEGEFKKGFKKYICVVYDKPEEYADKVIRFLDKYINPVLSGASKSYPNIFLFDDVNIASTYIKKVSEIIAKNMQFDEKAKKTFNRYLSYLSKYYKCT